MSFTLCTSGQAIAKAGAGVNSAIIISGQLLEEWSDEAEGYICAATRQDWVSGSLTYKMPKGILADAAASKMAISMINYDMSNYTSKREAETMLDVLRDSLVTDIEILKEQKNQEKLI